MKKNNYSFKISASKYIDMQKELREKSCELEKEAMEESKELYHAKPNSETANIYANDKKIYKLKKQAYNFPEFFLNSITTDDISIFILILSYCFDNEEPNYDKALEFYDKYVNNDKVKTTKNTHKDIVLLILEILEDSGQIMHDTLLRAEINKIYKTIDENIYNIEKMTEETSQELINDYISNNDNNIIIDEQ